MTSASTTSAASPDAASRDRDPQSGVELGGSKRVVALDALRGVAIVMVIIHHVGLGFPGVGLGFVGSFLVNIGWAGVDLFFAISGYLIITILMRDASAGALEGFFIRRFFRIVPLYALALGLFLVSSLLLGNERDVLHRLWIDALFLTSWVIPFWGENGVPYLVTWSVSVEEFAYLLFGALALLGPQRFRKALVIVIFGALILRIVAVAVWKFDPDSLYYFAPGRIDAIGLGGVAAIAAPRLSRLRTGAWLPWMMFVLLVGFLSARGLGDVFVATAGYTLIALAASWLVSSIVLGRNANPNAVTRILANLGSVSYFVYLFHKFVIGGLQVAIPASWIPHLNFWLLAAFVAVATYIPARMSWKFFEHPLISMGRRIASRREARAACG